jgi:hypothetical protein
MGLRGVTVKTTTKVGLKGVVAGVVLCGIVILVSKLAAPLQSFRVGVLLAEYVLALLFLLGGLDLIGTVVQVSLTWLTTKLQKRNLRFPRITTALMLASGLFLVAFLVRILFTYLAGQMILLYVAMAWLFIGGCWETGNVMRKAWKVTAAAATALAPEQRYAPSTGGDRK